MSGSLDTASACLHVTGNSAQPASRGYAHRIMAQSELPKSDLDRHFPDGCGTDKQIPLILDDTARFWTDPRVILERPNEDAGVEQEASHALFLRGLSVKSFISPSK